MNMNHFFSTGLFKKLFITTVLSVGTVSLWAQSYQPQGLYKLKEIVHQDGKHMEAGYQQYKYYKDDTTLEFTCYPQVLEESFNFILSYPEVKPLQITSTSDSTFTLRWFNEKNTQDEHLFPSQTTIEENYEQVKDPTDAVWQVLNMLEMKMDKKHRLQGAWKMRGGQSMGNAKSQYWIVSQGPDTYQLFGNGASVTIVPMGEFPQGKIQGYYAPCTYLNENAIEWDERTGILNWFDGETASLTLIGSAGQPMVTVWDRCGLPQQIQKVFGTDCPQNTKDLSRFYTQGFIQKYGNQPDSIRMAYETFDYAVEANEKNNAIFPVLMRNGFEEEYKEMKESLLSRLMSGEINVDEAVGRYVYWFYKDFDRHTNCSSETFSKLRSETLINYRTLIPNYAPEPVGCKVDKDTYLLRLPSSKGDLPTWDWMLKKVEEFKQSGCQYLILDLRGNGGGGDAFGELFAEMMCDCSSLYEHQSFYMNSTENNKMLKKYCKAFRGTYMDRVLKEAESAEEGSYINWLSTPKGSGGYTPLVRQGAIIIDNYSASAGESPVSFVRTYSKSHAKVYGRDRSMGCEMSGNCNYFSLPNSNIMLQYPMTVTDEFEKACKDRNPGFKPDVIIPLPYPEQLTDNIDPWVLWVAKKMKK